LGLVGEDQKKVLNHLLVALPKGRMSLVFWVAVVGDSLNTTNTTMSSCLGDLNLNLKEGHQIHNQ
jgi:hypothetical protein